MDEKEVELKARELALAEREITLKEREAKAKIKLEERGLVFSSPLLIAIVSTVFGTAIGAGFQGYSDGRLERLKFEFSLVQEAFGLEDRDESAKQLRFIADSGVISNIDTSNLRRLADTPDEIPTLPRLSGAELEANKIHFATHGLLSDHGAFYELANNSTGVNKSTGERLSLLSVTFKSDGTVIYEAIPENRTERIEISADSVETDIDLDRLRVLVLPQRRTGAAR